MKNSYNFFDKIYCINLKYRTDRYNSSLFFFRELNINNVKYFLANKHPNGGRYGCFDSHINVIKDAYYNNYDNILIFEDDVKIGKYYNLNLLNKSINFMKNNKTWDIFYLGYFPFSYNYKYTIIENNLIQSNPFGGHAYCLNKKSIKKILELYQSVIGTIHFDIWLSLSNKFNTFCIAPNIFEDYNINSNFSLFIYNIHKHKLIIILLIILIILIYYKKIDNIRVYN